MRASLVAVALLLASSSVAAAKGPPTPVAVSLCGASGCARTIGFGWAYGGAFADTSARHPPLGRYYDVRVAVDRGERYFYVPAAPVLIKRGESALGDWSPWSRPAPGASRVLRRLAARVEPFSAPEIVDAYVGRRRVSDDPETYVQLLDVQGPELVPRNGNAVAVQLVAARPTPWTEAPLLYYPDDDVLQRPGGEFIRLPPDLAADIEAARPLGSRGRNVLPLVVPIGLFGALVVFAALGELLRMPRHTAVPTA